MAALFVASLVGDGLSISGASAWVLGSLTVWIVTMLGTLILPLIFLRNRVQAKRAPA